MERHEFEAIRDLPGKVIRQDIKFARRDALRPTVVADDIRIENELGIDLVLSISWNPEKNGKTFNVHVPGVGQICRLDVDSTPHRPAGRSHKHSLQNAMCPRRNLPTVEPRGDLDGKSLAEVFEVFCAIAHVTHEGQFLDPEGTP